MGMTDLSGPASAPESAGSELLAYAVAGDEAALARLLERAAPLVRARLHRAVPPRWQALVTLDDALQESYTEAFLHIRRLRPESDAAFVGWLTRLTRNNLIDAIRALETEKRGGGRARQRVARDDSAIDLLERLAARESTPSRVMARAEAVAALRGAIELLPERYRQVVTLYDLQGEPIDRVAAALGRSSGAVYMMRSRAHRLLADRLAND
jgi:RNA polymerase sigma-70 factor (ECF subfamily)